MKRILIPLLVLVLLCVSMGALAEGEAAVTLEVTNAAKLPIYAADDPFVAEVASVPEDPQQTEEEPLPVLVLPAKKTYQLVIAVQPKTVKNRRVDIAVEDTELVSVRGSNLTGLKPGETVLTLTSQEDPTVILKYRVIVIQLVGRISVTAEAKTVAVGDSMALTPAYLPEEATLKKVTWASGDERIAVVDENGVVTGMKRGTVRIIATATDGSNVRANISVTVTQNAEEITLNPAEVTVDVKKTAVLKATVLPQDTNDKSVVWSSSDESIATVNAQGRITGVAVGDCEIICTSKTMEQVQARAVVHVQQPVQSIAFGEAPVVYVGETGRLTWSVEPANATNPVLALTSGNERILTVSDDGTVTGIQPGETYVNALTTDGSYRRGRVLVRVMQHLTGVHMLRNTAYIDVKETAIAGAVLEPDKLTNHNMTWESADTAVATVEPVKNQLHRARITGVAVGRTTVTGTTEDGGLQTSIDVIIGDWSKMMRITDAYIDGKGHLHITVKNVSDDLPITGVTIEVEAYTHKGKPVSINTKDGTNVVKATYNKQINPGRTSADDQWQFQNYDKDIGFQWMTVRITQYQIDRDWVKSLRTNLQPKFEYKPR